MTLDEQIARFDELIKFLNSELPEFTEKVAASDLVALVTNRVVQRGEDFNGNKFSPYSQKTISAFRFWGKSRVQAAEKKVRKISRSKGVLSYKSFRELNNLKTDSKNFEFTGEMWRKFNVKAVSVSPNKVTIKIGGTTEAAQDKIDANSLREGISIIEASDSEKKVVELTSQAWAIEQINRILGA